MKFESVPQAISKGALYLVLFVPLIITSSLFFPYITGKNILFRVFVALAALSVSWVVWKERRRISLSPVVLVFGAFTLSLLVSAVLGVDLERSLWSNFERMEGWVTIALLFAYIFALIGTFRTKEAWHTYLYTSLAVSVLLAVLGLFETASTTRVDATFGNSTYFGVYTLFHLWIAAYFKFERWKEVGKSYSVALRDWRMWAFALAGILNLAAMYFTGTRSVALGLFVGLIVMFGILAFKLPRTELLRKWSIGVFTALILIVPLFLAIRSTDFVEESTLLSRFANISLEDDTTRSRVLLWGIGLEVFKERPIVGWGQDNFIYGFAEHYDPRMFDQEEWFDRAHNVFFDWLTQGGIVGLVLYLSIFAVALIVLWRSAASVETKAVFTGLLIAHFVNNFFVFDNITSYIMFAIVLAYIAHLGRQDQEKQLSEYATYTVIAVLGLISVFGLYTSLVSWQNGSDVIDAYAELRAGNTTRALELFETAYERGGPGKQEIVEQFALSVGPSLSEASEEEINEYVERAVTLTKQYVDRYPTNPRPALILGTLYMRIGAVDQARVTLERAVALMPEKQTTRLAYAEALLMGDDIDGALSITKEMYEANPHFDRLRLSYVLTLFRADRDDEALAVLNEGNLIDDPNLIAILQDHGHYEYIVRVLSERVKEDPDNPQLKVSLAAAYYEAGERGRAIQVMQQVINDHPDVREEATNILNDIVAGTFTN